MKASYSSAKPIIRDALLSDFGIKALRREFVSTPSARKEAAFVFLELNIDEQHSFQFRRRKNHLACSSGQIRNSA